MILIPPLPTVHLDTPSLCDTIAQNLLFSTCEFDISAGWKASCFFL